MSITCFIIGESGSGKTASLRNFNPADVALIQAVKKPLPFKPVGWTFYTSDQSANVIAAMQKAVTKGKKVVVIDDFQYVMAHEFMRRSEDKGFQKFTDIARHAWDVVDAATKLPDDVRVYFLSHIATDDNGISRVKTIGKMLDEKICLEGMVTIVLRTAVMNGDYRFRVVNSGADTVKSPMGMFKEETIENDLKKVDDIIKNYYGISSVKDKK